MSAVAAPPISTTVSGAPPVTAPTTAVTSPAGTPAVTPPAEDVTALKTRLAELEGQNGELTRTAQYWADRAKTGTPTPAKPADEAEPDVLDLLTTKGAKGLDELLAKRGYVRKDEMDGAINTRTAQVQKEAELVTRYPDLTNKKSEFFAATAQHYGELVKQGVPQHMAMEMAAERTDLQFLREGKTKTPQQEADAKKAQKEADRLARIAAQAGDHGGRGAAGEEEDDELTPEQKRTAIAMLAGDGVTDEQAIEKYKARAKFGVTLLRK